MRRWGTANNINNQYFPDGSIAVDRSKSARTRRASLRS